MESSTDIPNTMLKISAVLGFSGMPKYPMIPAVIKSGMMLGIMEMTIILKFLKSNPKPILMFQVLS